MTGESRPLVAALRRFASTRGGPAGGTSTEAPGTVAERCDFCGTEIPSDHRHVLDVQNRRILCACPTCLVRQSALGRYRPTGRRLLSLGEGLLSDELWSRFQIPIGLAFFLKSGTTNRLVALYPSPAGATESELDLEAWDELRAAHPILDELEPDSEALLVCRTTRPPAHFIAPIDDCYRLVGLVKARWKGISGGSEVEEGIAEFVSELQARARVAP